jgi:hypothetical protein
MSASQRPRAASVVAAVVILLAGCGSGDGEKADPAPSAQPTPSATSACPQEGGGTCRGDLAAGTYTAATFQPAITYTVPAGWANGIDVPRNFLLARAADPVEDFYGGNAVTVMTDVRAAAQSCEQTPEPAVGRTADQLARWVAGLPGLQTSDPRPATVGGWHGFVLDVRLAAGWTKTCPYAEDPIVPLTQTGDPAQFHPIGTFIPKGGASRLYFLDAPGGGNLMIDVIDIPGGMSLQDYAAVAAPVIDSMHFAA